LNQATHCNTDTAQFDWNINWTSDLNKSFQVDIENFQAGLDLYEMALAENDELAALAGLLDARGYAHQLMDFFMLSRKI
jgi:hypothetical protein